MLKQSGAVNCNFSFNLSRSDKKKSYLLIEMADLDLGDSKVDPELQEFLMLEKQKAQVNAQVRKLFDFKEFSSIATF